MWSFGFLFNEAICPLSLDFGPLSASEDRIRGKPITFDTMRGLSPAILIVCILLRSISSLYAQSGYMKLGEGEIQFISEAPLETIEASTSQIEGLLDKEIGAFAIILPIMSFEGFNNALQQVHFNENYMDSEKHPKSNFEGKIIEDVDFEKKGTYDIRAKGTLEIHGIKKERIIDCQLTVGDSDVFVTSTFFVPLIDHDISIPKVVKQKISPEIEVHVELSFQTP